MSRAAILKSLRDDATLGAIVPSSNIFPSYSREGRPDGTGGKPFIILRWGDKQSAGLPDAPLHGPVDLTVWAHWPAEKSTDFNKLESILNRVTTILLGLEDVPGEDGSTVTCVRSHGMGGDYKDDGFNTITKTATYTVLSRAS